MVVNGGNITIEAGEHTLSPLYVGGGLSTGPESDIIIQGQGTATVLKRGTNNGAGLGLINVYGKNITLRDFVIDGSVTTSAGVLYSSLTDPFDGVLDVNTSIWVHPGATNIRFENVIIRNTGGYAILLDSRAGGITNVEIINCRFENNRPHLFGTS